MTPETFATNYRWVANLVSAKTGIDPIALLAQWANETAWGETFAGQNNLGNIQHAGVSLNYRDFYAFANDCADTWKNGYYNPVLSANNAIDQLAAICRSPWAAGHYAGSRQLLNYYEPLEAYELTPAQAARQEEIANKLNEVWDVVTTGTHAPQNPNWLGGILNAILNKPPVVAGPPDPTLKAAIDAIGADVKEIRARIDKDLA